MRRRLYIKFILAYAVLALLFLLVVSTLGAQLVENRLVSQNSSSMYTTARELSKGKALTYLRSGADLSEAYDALKVVAEASGNSIRIINTQGTMILNTETPLKTAEPDVIKDFDYASFGPRYYQISDLFSQYAAPHLNVIHPIIYSQSTRGYTILSCPMDRITKDRDGLMRPMYIITAVNFALSLIILLVFTFVVYSPLELITNGAKEFASGNLYHKIDVRSRDEMGYLSDSLNYMAAEIKKNNDYQQQFISNISHDFRSPLTSIKGFTEAMTDGTIPPEMHEKYLKIISAETDRLEKLTQSVLTLNKMSGDMGALNYSDFDINRVIRHTAAVFEGTCRKKKISIDLVLTGHELTVHADKEKIRQVLYNLLDNAIKFSNRNSEVRIETSVRHGKCFLSVKDEGVGISKEDLQHIWDRFYKTDSSRGRDRTGTGLGLSIVREIIQAHGQTISVVSTENVGTEFVFSLELGE